MIYLFCVRWRCFQNVSQSCNVLIMLILGHTWFCQWFLSAGSTLWPTWVKYACDSFVLETMYIRCTSSILIYVLNTDSSYDSMFSKRDSIVVVWLILGERRAFSFSVLDFRCGDIFVKKIWERGRLKDINADKRFGWYRLLLNHICYLNKWSYMMI